MEKELDQNEGGAEEDLSDQLSAEQNRNLAQQEINHILKEGQQFGEPSWLKYGFLFAVAGTMDIADVFDYTVVGMIVSKPISFVGTALISSTLWLTNGKMKRAQSYGVQLEGKLATPTFQKQNLQPALKEKLGNFVKKTPLNNILAGGGLNLIPWVGAFNPMVYWVYRTYRNEKQAYRQAREAATEAAQQFEQTQAA